MKGLKYNIDLNRFEFYYKFINLVYYYPVKKVWLTLKSKY